MVRLLIRTQFVRVPQNLQENFLPNKIKKVRFSNFLLLWIITAGIIKNMPPPPPPLHPTSEKNLSSTFCPIGDCKLVQDVRAMRQETNSLDPLIFKTVRKMTYPVYRLLNSMLNVISFLIIVCFFLISIFRNQTDNFQLLKLFEKDYYKLLLENQVTSMIYQFFSQECRIQGHVF